MSEARRSEIVVQIIIGRFGKSLYRGGGGGGCNPKKPKKTEKKTSPKFEICGSVRFFFRLFSVFSGIFRYFFGLNFDKKFQSFKNHVNNEAKNCLITYLMPIKPCKCLIKAIISKKNHLTRSR